MLFVPSFVVIILYLIVRNHFDYLILVLFALRRACAGLSFLVLVLSGVYPSSLLFLFLPPRPLAVTGLLSLMLTEYPS